MKDWIAVIALVVIAGLMIWQRFDGPGGEVGISPEVQRQLDSLERENTDLLVDKRVLQQKNWDLTGEVEELNIALKNVGVKYVPVFKEYNEGSREKKSEIVKGEYEKRLKEREGDK